MAESRKALAFALGALLLAAAPAAGQAVERSLAVAVLDADGAPASGLDASDFIVREDGARREVLRVEPDPTPLDIALLVDTSVAAGQVVSDFRRGLTAFITAMDEADRMAIIGFGGPPRILAPATRQRAPLLEVANGLFAGAGDAAYLLDAMTETAAGFIKRAPARPVMVVLATEGLDHSFNDSSSLLRTLQEAAITVQTVVLSGRGFRGGFGGRFGGLGRFDPLRDHRNLGSFGSPLAEWRIERDMTLQRAPGQTGGRRRELLTPSGMERTLLEVAAELNHRWLVVYAAPRALVPPDEVSVEVTGDGLSARGVPVDRRND